MDNLLHFGAHKISVPQHQNTKRNHSNGNTCNNKDKSTVVLLIDSGSDYAPDEIEITLLKGFTWQLLVLVIIINYSVFRLLVMPRS